MATSDPFPDPDPETTAESEPRAMETEGRRKRKKKPSFMDSFGSLLSRAGRRLGLKARSSDDSSTVEGVVSPEYVRYMTESRIGWLKMMRERLHTLLQIDREKHHSDEQLKEIQEWHAIDYLILIDDNLLPPSIGKCQNVRLLHLGYGVYGISIPEEIQNLTRLYKLHLPKAQLESLPDALFNIAALEDVNLENNRLTDIPDSIQNLPKLKYLNISNNQLTSFPVQLCSLSSLESLHLGSNKLHGIPKEIKNLKNLGRISLSNANLTSFEEICCKEMKKLEFLYLNGNQITEIPQDIKDLVSLKELDLSGNQITAIPDGIVHLVALCKLYFAHNAICDIMPVCQSELSNIEILSFHENALRRIPGEIGNLFKLRELYMGGNKLTELPDEVCHLSLLRTLDLSKNKLSHLPEMFDQLKHLLEKDIIKRGLSLDENPLIQPPMSVCERGIEAIHRYLRDLRASRAIKTARLQLHVLGETTAGKTSLVRTLTSGQSSLTAMADRTRVVDQVTYTPQEEVSLHINDFGGHEVYRIVPNFFLTPRAVVLLVLDLKVYEENSFDILVGSWIECVLGKAPEAHLIPVATHADICTDEDIERKIAHLNNAMETLLTNRQGSLQAQAHSIATKIRRVEQLPNFQTEEGEALKMAYEEKQAQVETLLTKLPTVAPQPYVISSKTKQGIDQLDQYLQELARDRGVILPETWFDMVDAVLRAQLEPPIYLDGAMLQRLWTTVNADDVMAYMKEAGHVMWFEDSNSLRHTIFHKKEIVLELLKAVFRHDMAEVVNPNTPPYQFRFTPAKLREVKEDLLRRGIVSEELLQCLWDDFKMKDQEVDTMRCLLTHLELCYEVPPEIEGGSLSLHFPWLLTSDIPDTLATRWPDQVPPEQTQLTLEVHFNVPCPIGFFERTSVALHKHLGIFKTTREDWLDGIVSQVAHDHILLRRSSNRIVFAIRGPRLPPMWTFLIKMSEQMGMFVDREWPGVIYDMYLVCPHCVQTQVAEDSCTRFPAEVLKQYEVSAENFPCQNAPPSCLIPAFLVTPYAPDLGFMTRTNREALRRMRLNIVHDTTEPAVKNILDWLNQEGVLSDREMEDIRCIGSTEDTPDMVARLLDMLPGKGDRAFHLFCEGLRDNGYPHMCNALLNPPST
ncbi:malignant fibrous histiocytoma-amplified sequence 1 homolog [Lingula anatina]|uniref:Malignant fibrous histiocytoma-amplified sequence 1 homolog n=1 Tax=Lingula anatina TaxID=7574 RepID=A0A1S3I0Q4_LINAN|nr:malignant fibrous histiocytoma-amplified sequence 1 homolog [Lingula anatina]|eukprot:XP_013391845.1 malignant fibrous histiocytoma-amplified sequence 1 homolog [Lingula anatina]